MISSAKSKVRPGDQCHQCWGCNIPVEVNGGGSIAKADNEDAAGAAEEVPAEEGERDRDT